MISIKNKQKMYKTHFINGNTSQKQFYKAYANKLTKVKFKSRQLYYQDELFKNKSNQRKTWGVIKTLIHTTSKKAKLPNKISAEQCTICEPEQMASIFNEFFSNIGKNLANKISAENQPCPSQYLPNPISSSMFLENPRPNEVFNIIASLSNSRSCDYDGIPSYFLKIAADVISNPFCYLFEHFFLLEFFRVL